MTGTDVERLATFRWVHDLTAAFMQALYTGWEAGSDKAQALRQAMAKIRQDPSWRHPHYLDAFVLLGDRI